MPTQKTILVNVMRHKDEAVQVPTGVTWKITAVGVNGDLSLRVTTANDKSEELLRNCVDLSTDLLLDDQNGLLIHNHSLGRKPKTAAISLEESP